MAGPLLEVLDLSADERFVLLATGPGAPSAAGCSTATTRARRGPAALPHRVDRPRHPATAPPTADAALVAYLVTDAGLRRAGLVAVPIGADGRRGQVGAVAQRSDAELELVDADRDGPQLLLVWNVDGRSELELLDTVGPGPAPGRTCPARSSAAGC